jgi:hypothetical protein
MTTNSQRALAASHTPPKPNNGVGEMPKHEQALSERYRLAGEEWADAHTAAKLLEELKTATLAKMKNKLMGEMGQMSEAKADRLVRSSEAWESYIRDMLNAENKAIKLKVQLKSLEIANSERIDMGANHRHEARLTR